MGAEERPPDGDGLTFAVDVSLPMELGLEAGILELERGCDIFHFIRILPSKYFTYRESWVNSY